MVRLPFDPAFTTPPFIEMKPTLTLACLLILVSPFAALAEDHPKDQKIERTEKKADAGALTDRMVKMLVAELPAEQKGIYADKKFVATELQIEGLWDALGFQLFDLTSGSDGVHELFTCSSGELKQLPVFADYGVLSAVVHEGSLYFTCKSGSGILTTILNKISRGKDKALTHETLGAIDAKPAEFVDKDVVKNMQDVIGKLKPVKNGAEAPSSKAKPEAMANEVKPPADGDYTLKLTLEAKDPQVQFPRSVIPDEVYQPYKKEGDTLKIRISEQGKKITIAGDSGTLEKQTATESIYDLPEGGSAKAGAQLRLRPTADGVFGTYTTFGSGLPVLSSLRGEVKPAASK
ncbi:MAG: hypothetical protein CFE26_00235 [Verrucomicrobiales bacterium VVV1]|nr:MAG: hypothetical protein CFE26_00235 [Verrucomicrobiales bacterium VVV1]